MVIELFFICLIRTFHIRKNGSSISCSVAILNTEMRFDGNALTFCLTLLCEQICMYVYTCSGYVGRCCVTYVVAEVTNCKQADIDYRGHEENFSEHGGVMDYEQDRNRQKR